MDQTDLESAFPNSRKVCGPKFCSMDLTRHVRSPHENDNPMEALAVRVEKHTADRCT